MRFPEFPFQAVGLEFFGGVAMANGVSGTTEFLPAKQRRGSATDWTPPGVFLTVTIA